MRISVAIAIAVIAVSAFLFAPTRWFDWRDTIPDYKPSGHSIVDPK
jgi:hypothetical protein